MIDWKYGDIGLGVFLMKISEDARKNRCICKKGECYEYEIDHK